MCIVLCELRLIFDKILKRFDLEFGIILDKEICQGGETVKGTLTIISKKGVNVRALRLIIEGIEKTEITIQGSSSSDTTSGTTNNTYRSTNTFFFKDLSNVLQQLNMNTLMDRNKLMVMVNSGIKEIPFEFDIPVDAYPSYNGKFATITYHVKATADRDNWIDKNKEIIFSVINSKHKTNHMITNKINDYHLRTNDIDLESTTPNNNDLYTSGTKGTEKTYENLYRINYNSSKHRDNYIKENPDSKVEFIMIGNGNSVGNSIEGINIYSYSPGQTIKGNIIVLKELINKKVNKLEISINGMEYAYAQGFDTFTRVESYELKSNLKDKLEEMQSKNTINKWKNNEIYEEPISDSSSSWFIIPFEIKIPDIVNRSYVGKYSEYFWGFDAKIDISLSNDIHARALIEIV